MAKDTPKATSRLPWAILAIALVGALVCAAIAAAPRMAQGAEIGDPDRQSIIEQAQKTKASAQKRASMNASRKKAAEPSSETLAVGEGLLGFAPGGTSDAGGAGVSALSRAASKVTQSITALAAGDVFTITLDGNSGTEEGDSQAVMGTERVYLKYGTGFFLDAAASSQRMTPTGNGIAIPTRKAMIVTKRLWIWNDDVENANKSDQNSEYVGNAAYGHWEKTFEETDHDYRFGGYWTGENGTGTQVIGDDGYLLSGASSTFANHDLTLYARWYCAMTYCDDTWWKPTAEVETQLGVPIVPDTTKVPRPEAATAELGYFPGCWLDLNMSYRVEGWWPCEKLRLYYRCASEVSDAQTVSCDSDMNLALRYWRVVHFYHYVDGMSLLEKDSKRLQQYSDYHESYYGMYNVDFRWYDRAWFDSVFDGYNASLDSIDNVYRSTYSLGWKCVGWQQFSDGSETISRPALSPGKDSWWTGNIGYTGAQYWGAVYERDITVQYNINRMRGTIRTTTTMKQAITCHAPISTKPYGIIGYKMSGNAPSGEPVASASTLKMDNYNFRGWSGRPDVYDWENDPGGAGVLENGNWTVDGKSLTRRTIYNGKAGTQSFESVTVDTYVDNRSLWTDRAPTVTLYAIERPNVYYVDIRDYNGYPTKGYTNRTQDVGDDVAQDTEFFEFYGIGYSLDYGFSQRVKEADSDIGEYRISVPHAIGGHFDGYYTGEDGEGKCVIDENGYIKAGCDATEYSSTDDEVRYAWETWTTPFAHLDMDTYTLTIFSSQKNGNLWIYEHYGPNGFSGVDAGLVNVKDVNGTLYSGDIYWGFGNDEDATIEWSPYGEKVLTYNLDRYTEIKHVKVAENQTVHLVNCGYMFANQLTLEDVEGFERVDTTGCVSFERMFMNCRSLKRVSGLENLDSSSATLFNEMFEGCSSLEETPDLSKWDLSKATSLKQMFAGCSKMPSAPATGSWGVSSECSDLTSMFKGCASMASAPDTSGWETSAVTSMRSMFEGCSSMAAAPDVSRWDVSACTDIVSMFQRCASMASAPDMGSWRTGALKSVDLVFSGCSSMTTAPDVSGWDTSGVTTARSLFANCRAMAEAPDLSGWDVSALTDVQQMFYHCAAMIEAPGLFDWTYTGATSLEGLFSECKSMGGMLDLSGWHLSNVSSTFAAFYDCEALEELDIAGLATTSATSNVGMFDYCYGLKAVTLGAGFTFTDADDHGAGYSSYTCILPEPMPHGLWINSSHASAEAVTPAALKANWNATGTNNSYNAGRYVSALSLRYMNHEAEMGRAYVPWDTDFAAEGVSGLANEPDFETGTGWGFAGWAANDETSTVKYTDGGTVRIKDDADLYCVYSRPISFTYYPGAAAAATSTRDVTQYYRTGKSQDIATPLAIASTAYGWRPIGWYKATSAPSSSDEAVHLTADATNPNPTSNETKYFAVYERDAVTVNYEGNRNTGGETPASKLQQSFVAGASSSTLPGGKLAENGFTKTDCEFVCWTLGSTEGDEHYVDDGIADDAAFGSQSAWASAPASTGSVTMYASWEAVNVKFTTPTRIVFKVLADGTVVSPAANTAAIGNRSAFDLDVIGCKVAEQSGVEIVDAVTAANQMAVTMQPQGYTVQKAIDLVSATWKDVSWHIAEGADLPLAFKGEDVVKIDALGSDGAVFGEMEFLVEADV